MHREGGNGCTHIVRLARGTRRAAHLSGSPTILKHGRMSCIHFRDEKEQEDALKRQRCFRCVFPETHLGDTAGLAWSVCAKAMKRENPRAVTRLFAVESARNRSQHGQQACSPARQPGVVPAGQ